MHILLIHQAFAALDEPGGTRHHEFARYLARAGHRVTIIASPISYLTGAARLGKEKQESEGEHPDEANITILRTYTYGALHKSFVHRVFSFFSFMASSFLAGLRVKEVDLVWGTSPPIFQGVTAWALAWLKQVPFLFEVRDLWPAFAIAVGVLRNGFIISLSEWLERFLYQKADRVMVNSPGFTTHVKERGGREVVLVQNGADTRMFDPFAKGETFREAHGLGKDFVALYAGAHGMSNDLGVVVEAAALLRDEPKIRIVLLGDGKEKPALVEKATEMGLTNLHFIPPVPKTDIPKALAAANTCIGILKPIPMYATVYPNKIFDYMAAGRPVVLAMEGVIREVVERADAGVAIPPGDASALAEAIRSLAADPERCRQHGESGRQHVEAFFDRGKVAERLEEVLESLVAGTG